MDLERNKTTANYVKFNSFIVWKFVNRKQFLGPKILMFYLNSNEKRFVS